MTPDRFVRVCRTHQATALVLDARLDPGMSCPSCGDVLGFALLDREKGLILWTSPTEEVHPRAPMIARPRPEPVRPAGHRRRGPQGSWPSLAELKRAWRAKWFSEPTDGATAQA